MELVDRYVKAVTSRLPEKRRADIERELRSAIMDVLDGRAARTEDQVAAVLREFGAPATVAANYHPSGQYLIGPELYPAYRRVLGQALAIVVALGGLWLAVQLALRGTTTMDAGDLLRGSLELAFRAAIGTLIGITATFVALQRLEVTKSLPEPEWDPRTLPALLAADRVSRAESAFSLVILAIAMTVVGAIGNEATTRIDGAPTILRPLIGGALVTAIPWLMASMLAEAAMHAGLLVEGRRRPWWRIVHVFSDVLAAVAFGIAAAAVYEERGALGAVGMPAGAIAALLGSLLAIALFILGAAVVRERRLTRRRASERTQAALPLIPV